MRNVFAQMICLLQKKTSCILVTVVSREGSAPRGIGSQMLVSAQGRVTGTIGGGAVEKLSTEYARELLKSKENALKTFSLHSASQDAIGMLCGGTVRVFFQYIKGDSDEWLSLAARVYDQITLCAKGYLCISLDDQFPIISDQPVQGSVSLPLPIGERVLLFGAGHCAQALAPLLSTLGFRVTVYDNREAFCSRDVFPHAEEIIVEDFRNIRDHLSLHPEDYAVVMTSGHAYDLEVQDQLLRQEMAYVGVIGSRRKKAAVNARLLERGISQEMIDTVHTPIGLDIGAVTPEEIAVSIAAEMIQVRAERRMAAGTFEKSCPMH